MHYRERFHCHEMCYCNALKDSLFEMISLGIEIGRKFLTVMLLSIKLDSRGDWGWGLCGFGY